MDRQCSSCGGFCKKSGCERENVKPEPEPVAWGVPNTRPTEKARFMMLLHSLDGCQYPKQLVPLYTAPPQREWQGLTNDEVNNFAAGCHLGKSVQGAIYEAAAKLKEKNSG